MHFKQASLLSKKWGTPQTANFNKLKESLLEIYVEGYFLYEL